MQNCTLGLLICRARKIEHIIIQRSEPKVREGAFGVWLVHQTGQAKGFSEVWFDIWLAWWTGYALQEFMNMMALEQDMFFFFNSDQLWTIYRLIFLLLLPTTGWRCGNITEASVSVHVGRLNINDTSHFYRLIIIVIIANTVSAWTPNDNTL